MSYQEHPQKRKARSRVNAAVAAGRMPRASTVRCVECDEVAAQYDHHNGYDAEHELDVEPVCRSCHDRRKVARQEMPRGASHPWSRDPSLIRRGERNNKAKMTAEGVLELRRLRALGETLEAIGRRFGITKQSARAIALRQAWRHVP